MLKSEGAQPFMVLKLRIDQLGDTLAQLIRRQYMLTNGKASKFPSFPGFAQPGPAIS